MDRLDVDRQAGSFLPPRTFLISGHRSSSSISIIINCLFAAMSLLRRHLVCFYCGRRSAKGHPSGTRQWECGNCEAVNHLDEVSHADDSVYLLPPLSLSTKANQSLERRNHRSTCNSFPGRCTLRALRASSGLSRAWLVRHIPLLRQMP